MFNGEQPTLIKHYKPTTLAHCQLDGCCNFYLKKNNSQKYCTPEHSKQAQMENNRIRSDKHYHRWGRKKQHQLGTGSLGSTPNYNYDNPDFEGEKKKIIREKKG